MPSSGDAVSEPETVACTDGVDNDKDGGYDWLGACDTGDDGTIDTSCSTLLADEVNSNDLNEEHCQAICEIHGIYYSDDTQCDSEEDDSESAVVASSLKGKKLNIKFLAPEGEETLLEKILRFLFITDETAWNTFFDASYLRK